MTTMTLPELAAAPETRGGNGSAPENSASSAEISPQRSMTVSMQSQTSLFLPDDMDEATMRQVWARRAEHLAQKPVEEDQSERLEIVLVRLGVEIFGLQVGYIHSIRPADQITRVPRVPPWVTGVVNLRGKILSVIDLELFFGLPVAETRPAEPAPARYLVVAEAPLMELAIGVDEVLAVEPLPVNRLQEATAMIRGVRPEYITGVAEREVHCGDAKNDLVIVLDMMALLSDLHLLVNQEAL